MTLLLSSLKSQDSDAAAHYLSRARLLGVCVKWKQMKPKKMFQSAFLASNNYLKSNLPGKWTLKSVGYELPKVTETIFEKNVFDLYIEFPFYLPSINLKEAWFMTCTAPLGGDQDASLYTV